METSQCRCRISLPGKHANIARSWDLFPKYASSTHLKNKTTAYIHIYVWYKYPLKRNCHIFRPIRCEEHVVWLPALSLCAIPFNGIPLLVSCITRWGMPELRCPRNGSLDNDDTEKSLRLSTLHKWNQQIWHRSRTPIFLSFLLAVDRKSVQIYCAQRRLFTVSVSLSAAWNNNNAYLICILLLCPLINMFCMHCRWKCIVYFLKCDIIYSSRKRCAD